MVLNSIESSWENISFLDNQLGFCNWAIFHFQSIHVLSALQDIDINLSYLTFSCMFSFLVQSFFQCKVCFYSKYNNTYSIKYINIEINITIYIDDCSPDTRTVYKDYFLLF